MLRQIADQIDSGQCGLDDEELVSLGSVLIHRKMNIEQTCNYYGVSRATIHRWQEMGKLPPFKKDAGGKDYIYLDEAEEAIRIFNDEQNPS